MSILKTEVSDMQPQPGTHQANKGNGNAEYKPREETNGIWSILSKSKQQQEYDVYCLYTHYLK